MCNDWLWPGRSGDRIPVGTRLLDLPGLPWGPPSLLYNGYCVFPGGKLWPRHAADHSPPSSAAVTEDYSYISTQPIYIYIYKTTCRVLASTDLLTCKQNLPHILSAYHSTPQPQPTNIRCSVCFQRTFRPLTVLRFKNALRSLHCLSKIH
jgi:hypothetical protein